MWKNYKQTSLCAYRHFQANRGGKGWVSKLQSAIFTILLCNWVFLLSLERPTEVQRFPEFSRVADKSPAALQMKLTRFKSNHNWFISYTKIHNYTIIKMVKLKSLGLIKAWENNAMKQMKSLGNIGSRKNGSFYPKIL